jgi:hypothetical protein
MNLSNYFESHRGTGILSTANDNGEVNGAIYARPHFLDENSPHKLSFVMRDRLTRAYLQTNPHAFYTFIEEGKGYRGRRLALRKVSEESDRDKIAALRRRNIPDACEEKEKGEGIYLVHFEVTAERPLVGSEESL